MATIVGTSGNDVITPSGVSSGVTGGVPSNADDLIGGYDGNDSIDASGGDDTIIGSYGNDTLLGGLGHDSLDGGTGADSLLGGDGNDTLTAEGSDTLDGGAADDLLLVGSDQAYTLRGGAGYDTVAITSGVWYTGSFSLAANGIEQIEGNAQEILGTAGNDSINFTGVTLMAVAFVDGADGNDVLTGNAAANTLRGGLGNDTLVGGAGNDLLDDSSSTGADSLRGGDGNDTLHAYGNDTLDGEAGDDRLVVWSDQAYVLRGGAGYDTVWVASSAWYTGSFSLAANGIEEIYGNAQEVLGTAGNDTIDFTGVTLNAVAFVDGADGNDSLTGNAAANTLRGGYGNDTLVGGAGNDRLDDASSSGADSLLGGDGNDTLYAYGNDTLDGGAGDDRLVAWSDQAYSLVGGAGYDTVWVASSVWYTGSFSLAVNGIEQIYGNAQGISGTSGNDSINFAGVALTAVEFVDGADGNDSVTGNAAANTLRGGLGNDTLVGGAGNDVLDDASSTGADSLLGGDGDDTLYAYGGDTLNGGAGDDMLLVSSDQAYTLRGGAGYDTVWIGSSAWYTGSFSLAANAIEEIYGNAQEIIGTSGNDGINFTGVALTAVAFVDGADGNDSLTGNAAANTLRGGYGNDKLIGGAGNDVLDDASSIGADSLLGGDGDDTLYAYGDDTLDGGAGADRLVVSSDQAYVLRGGSGYDTLWVGSSVWYTGSFSLAANGIEEIYGNAQEIIGTAGNDDIDFTGVTLAAVAYVDGADGNDTLTGNAAANALRGGYGSDSLAGGLGRDTLAGGPGQDIFRFDTLPSASGNTDIISDFVAEDAIHLAATVFTALTTGVLGAAAFFKSATATAAADAADRVIYNTTTGALYYDPDGTGSAAPVRFATLTGSPDDLTNADFVVV